MRSGVWSGSSFLSGRSLPCAKHTHNCAVHTSRRDVVHTFAQGFGALLNRTSQTSDRPKLTPHPVSPTLEVPRHIARPDYAAKKGTSPRDAAPQIHTGKGLKKMRAACQLAARVLQHAGSLVREGVTTDDIDREVHKMIVENGAYPSPLMYGGFPKSVCTSVNEVACHGIPDGRALQNGDILNIDVTVYLNGYHGDTSAMFHVGEVGEEARRLCEVAKLAMDTGIQQCKPGARVFSIGRAMQGVAKDHKLAVVTDFVGHGVGRIFHSEPFIHPAWNNEPGVMQVGQTFTIEPILCTGRPKIKTWKDAWTEVMADGGLAAQWEHTILITPSGHQLLTVPGEAAAVKGF